MKKFNKIISCLLLCALFSFCALSSASAMRRAIFIFDEELGDTHTSEGEDDAPEAAPAKLPQKIKTSPPVAIVASKADKSPEPESPSADSNPKKPTFKSESAPAAINSALLAARTQPAPILQTEETMREKKREFLQKYREILRKRGSHIDTLHMWKYEIFIYLKTLYMQLHRLPGTINDRQILNFFLDMVKELTPGFTPNLDLCDYRIRFDPVFGTSGAIVCSAADDPYRALAIL